MPVKNKVSTKNVILCMSVKLVVLYVLGILQLAGEEAGIIHGEAASSVATV